MHREKLKISVDNNGLIKLSLPDTAGNIVWAKFIKQLINIYNNKPFKNSNNIVPNCKRRNLSCPKEYDTYAYICFHLPTEMDATSEEVYNFAQETLMWGSAEYPIIHLVTYEDEDVLKNTNFHKRYARIMDSSIWNYYVCVKFTLPSSTINYDDSLTHLDFAVQNILNNTFYQLPQNRTGNLYKLAISHEYADLHARLLQQSYLLSTNKEHGKAVAPFLFHQEQKMLEEIMDEPYIKSKGNKENKAVEEKKEEDNGQTTQQAARNTTIPWKGTEISKYKWRILLLDDHVLEKMTLYDANEKGTTSRPDKLRIISNTLRRMFSGIKIGYVDYKPTEKARTIRDEQTREEVNNNEYDIVFYCVSNITNAETALRKHKFEIVLLDYLLGNDKDNTTREYSYTLLNYINDSKKAEEKYENNISLYKFGPHKRMYFMFISSFATAVNERLLAEGLHKSEKYWHIADGACPTNTPYLFLHRLVHLMDKRVKDMGIDKFMGINTKDEFEKSYIHKEIINNIYDPKGKDNTISNVRSAANEHFDDVLSLLYHYKRMLEDYQKPEKTEDIFLSSESTLATDFVDNHPKLGGFLEHLTQLVYLTAFGTVRQWPEMWEEYQFIRSITGERIESIEDHIYKLKTNS